MMTSTPTAADLAAIAKHAELDKRLTAAVRPIRLLDAVSWPAPLQERFLADWRVGKIWMPEPEYVRQDWTQVRAELDAIDAALDNNHPLGRYLHRTTESWRVATLLLDAIGTPEVTTHSMRLFGKPGGRLPGDGPTNLEAAQHFINLADELDQELRLYEPAFVLSAEQVQLELQQQIDQFMGPGQVSVELDPTLIAKAAAGATRLRLRTNTGFSEYDRNQLLMHEFFVHSVTGLNGR